MYTCNVMKIYRNEYLRESGKMGNYTKFIIHKRKIFRSNTYTYTILNYEDVNTQ
jgi:hypothetical protein